MRLAQNWLVRHLRVRVREGTELNADMDAAARDDPLAALITDERDRAVWRSVAALPSGERTAALLYPAGLFAPLRDRGR